MATRYTVTDTALKAGEPYGYAKVKVTLTDLNGVKVTAHVTGDPGQIVQTFTFHAHPVTGVWSVDLWANADLSRANTFYTVTIAGVSTLILVDGNGTLVTLAASTPAVLGPGATLDSLVDVVVPSPSDGDAVVWDAATSRWIAVAGGPGGASAFTDLTDVTLSSPIIGDRLALTIDIDGTVRDQPHVILGDGYVEIIADDNLGFFGKIELSTTYDKFISSDSVTTSIVWVTPSEAKLLFNDNVNGDHEVSVSATGAFVDADQIVTDSDPRLRSTLFVSASPPANPVLNDVWVVI